MYITIYGYKQDITIMWAYRSKYLYIMAQSNIVCYPVIALKNIASTLCITSLFNRYSRLDIEIDEITITS